MKIEVGDIWRNILGMLVYVTKYEYFVVEYVGNDGRACMDSETKFYREFKYVGKSKTDINELFELED